MRVRKPTAPIQPTLTEDERQALLLHRVQTIGRMVPVLGRRVLCLGADAEMLAEAFAARGAHATGATATRFVDATPGEPMRHGERLSPRGLGDLARGRPFDTAVVVEGINQEASPRTLLRQVLSVLRPGGLAYLQDIRSDAPRALIEERLGLTPKDARAAFHARLASAPDTDDLRAIFADLGPLVSQILPLNPAPPQTQAVWALEERLSYRYLLCRAHG